jgi:hypothetical protein
VQTLDQTQLTSVDILFLSLKTFDVQPSVDTFDDRKLVQKLAYILQQCGVRLNYRYTWYLHGPYSSDLTSDLYRIATQPDYFAERTRNLSFVPEIDEKVGKLKKILGPDANDTHLLEAVASILFIGPGWRETIRKVKPGLDMKVLERAEMIVRELVSQRLIVPSQIE